MQVSTRSIGGVTASTSQVRELVEEIHTGGRERACGIEPIGSAVTHIEQVTRRTAATAEDSPAAGRDLALQSQALDEAVARLRMLAGEDPGRPVRRAEPGHHLAARRARELVATSPQPLHSSKDLAALSGSLDPLSRRSNAAPQAVPVLVRKVAAPKAEPRAAAQEFPLDDDR